MNSVVRVAINNNFNCTDLEYEQLYHFTQVFENKEFFLNSNINTKNLHNIKNYNYNCVITVNPDIIIKNINEIIEKLLPIKKNIAFVRVKYIPHNAQILNLINTLNSHNFKIVITNMRFNSTASLIKFTKKEYYTWKNKRFHLNNIEFKKLQLLIKNYENIYICDEKNKGCQSCQLCSLLTTGKKLEIESINLSTSGICPFNCIDCYAKTMQNLSKKWGNKIITYNIIRKNSKQSKK